jgi:hypothetical protein
MISVDSNSAAPGGTVDGVVSPLTVNAGPGKNTLTLEDPSAAKAAVVTLTATHVGAASTDTFFGPGGSLAYSNLSTLTLNGGSHGNAITIESTSPGTAVNVTAGAGNDTLAVDSNGNAAGGTVNLIRSSLTLNGGGGTDILTLVDSSDASSDKVTFTATTIGAAAADTFFGQGGSLTYGSLAEVVMDLGAGGNTVDVTGQTKGTVTKLNTGDGNDTVNVFVGKTSAYQNFLVNGMLGKDRLNIIDVAMTGKIKKTNQNGTGWVDVAYQGGLTSRIDFQNVEIVTP